jgi:hypothetical protein
MSQPLIEAALRACITLSSAIDATREAASDGSNLAMDIVSEVQSDLVEAYNLLTNQLSIDLNLDARKLVQGVMEVELEASRAILTAQTGLRFPIAATVKE